MQKINCVILNFNDAERTSKLAGVISHFDYLEKVVVVDNASTDDSWEQLQILSGEKIDILRSDKNGGYGYGNNLGVRYSMEKTGATHVIIANPDTMFSEVCVRKMARIFANHPDVTVAGAVMEDTKTKESDVPGNAWRLHGFWGELLSMGPISRRLFGIFLNYPAGYFKGKAAVPVDVLHGSMLMVDAKAFLSCGGYDEKMFLYQEEAVLGWKMKTSGYRTILITKASYGHEHSVSIGKAYVRQDERQRLRHESAMHYFKCYLRINRFQEGVAKIWFAGIMAEIHIWQFICRLKAVK